MTEVTKVFPRTNQVFENAEILHLKRRAIEFPPATLTIMASSRLFQLLDRTDPVQAEISRRLWVLRSSILFTLLTFADPALRLQLQMDELEQLSEGVPEAAKLINSLRANVTDIVNAEKNPKREWLLSMVSETEEIGPIGVFTALASGTPPGWPQAKSGDLSAVSDRVIPIGSRKTLRSTVFSMVILPCGCSNAPPSLLSQLLFSGATAKIEILLYPGEKFQVPKRLRLPDEGIFSGHLQESQIDCEELAPEDAGLSAVDAWMNEAFWQGLHGAARRHSHSLCPAKYVLFCDGTGAFLPADGRVMTLPADGNVTAENELCMVRVEDVCEGDTIVLRSGDPGFLLDQASERLVGHEGNESLFEIATDWKHALDALLVTQTAEEVATALRKRGGSTSATSVHQWAGPEVLGPGNERLFRELLNVLADNGKIQKSGAELTNYADRCWQSLQALRGLHQKAGNQIRQDLFRSLLNRFGNGSEHRSLSHRETIRLEGDTGAELLVLRVASVDGNTAYVQPSRLGKLDDLRGNKWLG